MSVQDVAVGCGEAQAAVPSFGVAGGEPAGPRRMISGVRPELGLASLTALQFSDTVASGSVTAENDVTDGAFVSRKYGIGLESVPPEEPFMAWMV